MKVQSQQKSSNRVGFEVPQRYSIVLYLVRNILRLKKEAVIFFETSLVFYRTT
jgi:hypothetical protein